jgi:hypothetical protein
MDLGRLVALAAELGRCTWEDEARRLGQNLRLSASRTGDLLVVGTPDDEPGHLVDHLAAASRAGGGGEMPGPSLLRWRRPPGLAASFSAALERLGDVRRSTLLVVVAESAPAGLAQRVADARHRGATVFALITDSPVSDARTPAARTEWAGLAHEAVLLGAADPVESDLAAHVLAAGAARPRIPVQPGPSPIRDPSAT